MPIGIRFQGAPQCLLSGRLARLVHAAALIGQLAVLTSALAQQEESGIRPARFKDITPGETSIDETKRILGEPRRRVTQADQTTLIYKIDPFVRVEVVSVNQTAQSIVLFLAERSSADELAGELGLTGFRPAPVIDENGDALGQVYPERGVLFAFKENGGKKSVKQIILDPISAEPFMLRAEHDGVHQIGRNLTDLDHAERLDPKDDRVFALKAQALAAAGQYSRALKSIEQAIELQDDAPHYQVLRAQLLADTNQYDDALKLARAIAEDASMPSYVRARGECLLGDLLAAGRHHNYGKAIKHHMAAVKLATKPATDRRADVRRRAKEVLLDAHLGVASDIAWGQWRRKQEVVPKWLNHAEAFADNLIAHESADTSITLRLHRHSLSALAGIANQIDPQQAAAAAIEVGEKQIEEVDDPLERARLEWMLGQALFDAARVYHAQKKPVEALGNARHAARLLESAAQHREAVPSQDYLLGRTFFLIGSLYAVEKNDHRTAVTWFSKSIERLSRPKPVSAEPERGFRGEWYVSMGVSYWKTGQKDRGLKLTERGVKVIKEAAREGLIASSSLAVPYGNLASMHRSQGDEESAQRYDDMAEKLESASRARSPGANRR